MIMKKNKRITMIYMIVLKFIRVYIPKCNNAISSTDTNANMIFVVFIKLFVFIGIKKERGTIHY